MGFYENTHFFLDYEMIYIDDERRINEYLNDSPKYNLS